MDAPFYPIFVSLEGRVCLVVGGGSVGERKSRKLLEYGAAVRVVARALTPWLGGACRDGRIAFIAEEYEEHHLEGVHLIFAATSDATLNRRVAADAEKVGIWCNMATEPHLGSFIVPAIHRQGQLTVAISTGGLSPALARKIRISLEKELGPVWSVCIQIVGALRTAVQAKGLGTEENQRIFRDIAQLPLIEWIQQNRMHSAVEAILHVCHPWLETTEVSHIWNEAWEMYFS